jgi:hypothetical protein
MNRGYGGIGGEGVTYVVSSNLFFIAGSFPRTKENREVRKGKGKGERG